MHSFQKQNSFHFNSAADFEESWEMNMHRFAGLGPKPSLLWGWGFVPAVARKGQFGNTVHVVSVIT